jgi:hypothetical protein
MLQNRAATNLYAIHRKYHKITTFIQIIDDIYTVVNFMRDDAAIEKTLQS